MLLREYTQKKCEEIVSPHWIGQGYGYKKSVPTKEAWDRLDPDEIVYVPEMAYNGPDGPDLEAISTKQDFIDLANEKAYDLFCSVDWQCPSAAWGEYVFEEVE